MPGEWRQSSEMQAAGMSWPREQISPWTLTFCGEQQHPSWSWKAKKERVSGADRNRHARRKVKEKKHHTGQGYVYFLLCRFSNVSIQYLLCDCAIFTNTEHTKHYCFPVFSVQSCRMFFSLTVSTQSLPCTWNWNHFHSMQDLPLFLWALSVC